jgi:hypothetical protein
MRGGQCFDPVHLVVEAGARCSFGDDSFQESSGVPDCVSDSSSLGSWSPAVQVSVSGTIAIGE